MSRISKDLAKQVSREMMVPQNEIKIGIYNEIGKLVTDHYLSGLPKEVKDFKFKEYISKNRSFYINTHIYNAIYWSYSIELPVKNGIPSIDLRENKDLCIKVEKLISKHKDKEKEYETLRKSIENTLIELRTYKNVKDMFPEAVSFLPENTSYLPSVDISTIRTKLKQF